MKVFENPWRCLVARSKQVVRRVVARRRSDEIEICLSIIWTVAFPKLTDAQIAELARFSDAAPKKFRPGEALFRCGDRRLKFFVIKSGEVEIIDETGETPKTVTVDEAGSFTGDVDHLTGNPAVVSGVAGNSTPDTVYA